MVKSVEQGCISTPQAETTVSGKKGHQSGNKTINVGSQMYFMTVFSASGSLVRFLIYFILFVLIFCADHRGLSVGPLLLLVLNF